MPLERPVTPALEAVSDHVFDVGWLGERYPITTMCGILIGQDVS
jgi:hypothetical protein